MAISSITPNLLPVLADFDGIVVGSGTRYGRSDINLAAIQGAEAAAERAEAAAANSPWSSATFADGAAFAAAVRASAPSLVSGDIRLIVKAGEVVRIPCNPTAGNDLKAYFEYMTLGHEVQTGGSLALEIADGLHNVSTFLDAANGQRVAIVGANAAVALPVNSITYADQGGGVWRATIVITGTLPAYLTAGCGVGLQNPVGNGTPDAAAGGLRVVTRVNATTLVVEFQSRGVVPLVNMTTPTAGTTYGMLQNQLIVPLSCIRANSAGWTAGGVDFVEGFVNARNGSTVTFENICLSYNGTADGHEMAFAKDIGSLIGGKLGTVIIGDCTNLTRSSYGGKFDFVNSFLGLGTSGESIWQGVAADCSASFVRTMAVGGVGEMLSPTSDSSLFVSQCVFTGGAGFARPTYSSASIDVATSRIRHCGYAAQPVRGQVQFGSDVSIERCTTPFLLTGSTYGEVFGNPSFANNTNTVITANEIQANGAVWRPGTGKAYDPSFRLVGVFSSTVNFASIPAAPSATSYEDITFAAAGVLTTDFCIFDRVTMAAQNVTFDAFCNADGNITVRATNGSNAAIDPAAFTAFVMVLRAT